MAAVTKEPQNLEAEIAVLGCAFLSQTALDKVCEEVTADMFYSDQNRKVFNAIKELTTKNIPIDSTTIVDYLEKNNELYNVGGIEYITEIIDSVATASNLDQYIKILLEKSILRNLINKSTNIITDCYEQKDEVEEIVENAERNILSINTDKIGKDIKSIQDVLPIVQEEIEELSKNKSGVVGVRSGFYDLDKLTRGFQKNQVIIIAGRPGAGKSAYALNIACNVALQNNQSVAFFTLEMGAEEIVKRMFSSVGQIEGDLLKTGKLSHNDWKKFSEAESQLADAKIFIDDSAGVTVGEIRRKCRRLKNSPSGLDIIIIDYLQLISASSKYAGNRVQEVSEVSRDIKKLAMELEVPVIALAQLSRSSEQRKGDDRKPKLSDLRESGSIEQDADMVMFLYSTDYYDQINSQNSEIEILLAKHRNGATGSFTLMFEKNMSSFKNYIKGEETNNE
ncbi:MAG: replicative DNA helicase [Bacilli bacterium]|nr:replicative DNA helicase [Bacilli bacterium]MBQ9854467.1 replicative DNA helicase [Bacilli bacterium]